MAFDATAIILLTGASLLARHEVYRMLAKNKWRPFTIIEYHWNHKWTIPIYLIVYMMAVPSVVVLKVIEKWNQKK